MNKLSDSYLSSTLSTTERHYGFKTKEMSLVSCSAGLISVWKELSFSCLKVIAANDITAVFITIPLIFYFNRKNKAYWCGVAQLIAAIANLLPLMAYLLIPPASSSSIELGVEPML